MANSSLLIKNAKVVDPSQQINRVMDIFVEDGFIKEIDSKQALADKVVDAKGLTLAPGLVDMHVHLREPGQTHKEDIISGCKAAAAGGVTSLLAMPNTTPVCDSPETVVKIKEKAEPACAKVYVAASITKGLKGEEACDFKSLADAGAIALTDDGRPVENTRYMAQAMKAAVENNMVVVAHCEDLFLAKGGIINEGKMSEQLGVNGIPKAAEDTGTAREIALAEAYGLPIHICHVSTKTSVDMIRDAKRRGVQITAETAPHYTAFTEEILLKGDADYRMNPPLRENKDRLAVIQGLKDGTLDAIATDHAPHTPEEKSNFLNAPNGVIGMETSLSACLTFLVQQGHLTVYELIDKMSCKPARILGIPAGTLKVGASADMVLFDEEATWEVDTSKLHGKSKNTPFKGMTLKGKVIKTFLEGEEICL